MADIGTTQSRIGPASPDKRHRDWVIMVALVLAEALSSFESSMIYAAMASFDETFHDPVGIGWVITGFMLVATISAAICGRLGDIFGRRRVLLIVMAVASVGSVISAAAPNLFWVVVGRSIQGVAGAILPLCYGLVRENFPDIRVGVNIGIISATASGGAMIGVLLGGVLVDTTGWRMIFVFSALLAVAAIIAVSMLVPKGRQGVGDPVDWVGAILFTIGLGTLLYSLGLGESHGWGGSEQLSFVAVGLVALIIWTWWELRVSHPMIDVRLMLDRQIGLTLLAMVFAAVGAMNINQIVLVMLQQPVGTDVGLGVSATEAGVLHMPQGILGVIASPLVGWYAARKGGRSGMILATAVISAAWIGMVVNHASIPIMVLWMSMSGFGVGALMAAVPNLIVEVAPAERTSEATGLAQIVRKIGMTCGAQLVAISLATSTVRAGSGAFPDASAYALSYGWVAIACFTAFLLSLLIPRRKRSANIGREQMA
jgi:MFS family permease